MVDSDDMPNAITAPMKIIRPQVTVASATSLPEGPNDNVDLRNFTPKIQSSCGDRRNSDTFEDTRADCLKRTALSSEQSGR